LTADAAWGSAIQSTINPTQSTKVVIDLVDW